MNALKVLTGAYFAGAALFLCALIIIALRFLGVEWVPSPTWLLFIGFALMIIPKLLARSLGVGVDKHG